MTRSNRVILVHGIATDGGSLFEMGYELQDMGYDVHYYRYEKRHFWSYWNINNMLRDASSFLHDSGYKPGCNVIAHSNGQLVVQSAAFLGAKFNKVIIFSGAGTSDKFTWPEESMKECHWFVNISDLAVWFGALLPNHPFGKAARRGYAGKPDSRHVNHKYDRDKWFNIDHSFWFGEWRERSIQWVREILG